MTRRLVYLTGSPGIGKTTVMRAVLADLGATRTHKVAPGLTVTVALERDVVLLGTYTGHPFDGTDRLSMAVAPHARAWIATRPAGLVLGEGDRLASRGFFAAAEAAGYDVVVVRLEAPTEVTARRRADRGASTPSQTWLRGRETKVQRLPTRFVVDAARPASEVAGALRSLLALDRPKEDARG